MKNSASDFVQDFIEGKLDMIHAGNMSPQELREALENKFGEEYSYTEAELIRALKENKEEISHKIGIELSEEELSPLTGGKSAAPVYTKGALYGESTDGSRVGWVQQT